MENYWKNIHDKKKIMKVINYLKRVNGSEHIVEHIGWHESGDYLLRQLFSESETGYRQHKYEVEQEYKVIDRKEVDTLERQTCPRRMGELGPFERKPDMDHWKLLPNGDRICSFCGSLHPATVIEIIKQHGFSVIERSDKQYKWYIHRKDIANALAGGIKYYRQHDTDEFIAEYNQVLRDSKK